MCYSNDFQGTSEIFNFPFLIGSGKTFAHCMQLGMLGHEQMQPLTVFDF